MVKPKEEDKKFQAIPLEVQQILDDFKDIISDGTPIVLPPTREIRNQIDFVPSASLCNKVTYKLIVDQNKEVARQVQELLDQGLIKKNISPYIVPMILESKKGGKWRLCTDSRAINMITIRHMFPVPRIKYLADCL